MRFTTIGVVTFGAGVKLGLAAAQAAPRQAVLQPVDGQPGWYATTGAVQFKRGEQFDYDGDMPKALAQLVQLPDGTTAAAQVRAKPKAAAKPKAGTAGEGA